MDLAYDLDTSGVFSKEIPITPRTYRVRIYLEENKLENPEKYYRVGQELLDGVVYDGFQTGMLLYTP